MMQGILIVDKPTDWTSFDVIAKLRGILGTRKLGHSGTLHRVQRTQPRARPVFCRCSAAGPARQLICSSTTPRPTALSSGWASAPIPGM